jgi:hypothetical protein
MIADESGNLGARPVGRAASTGPRPERRLKAPLNPETARFFERRFASIRARKCAQDVLDGHAVAKIRVDEAGL